ncbi:hypothetical protein D4764_0169970, partial [Takifugu flavidus]
MLPLGDVIRSHGISFHSYADDTQLYIAVAPGDTGPVDALFNCILDIQSWMAENFLQLNQDQTEVLVIGPEVLQFLAPVFPHGGLPGWEMFPVYHWGCCPVDSSGLGVRGLCALVWSLRSVRVGVVFVAVPPVVTDRDLPRPGGPPKVASPSPQVFKFIEVNHRNQYKPKTLVWWEESGGGVSLDSALQLGGN